jgi:hypothetical protein
MFGPDLDAPETWGVMPRVIDATLRMMRKRRAEASSSLLVSAVEFIGGFPFDLKGESGPHGRPMCQVYLMLYVHLYRHVCTQVHTWCT